MEVEALSSTVTGLLFGVSIVRLGKGLFVFVGAASTCDTSAIRTVFSIFKLLLQ